MIRNVVGILFFVVSGFFIYTIGLLAFFSFPDFGSEKLSLLGGLAVPVVLSHLVGLALYRGANWKMPTGITLVSGGSFNLLVVIAMLAIKASPEVTQGVDTTGLDAFSDYATGFTVMALFVGLGTILILLGKSARKPSSPEVAASVDA